MPLAAASSAGSCVYSFPLVVSATPQCLCPDWRVSGGVLRGALSMPDWDQAARLCTTLRCIGFCLNCSTPFQPDTRVNWDKSRSPSCDRASHISAVGLLAPAHSHLALPLQEHVHRLLRQFGAKALSWSHPFCKTLINTPTQHPRYSQGPFA